MLPNDRLGLNSAIGVMSVTRPLLHRKRKSFRNLAMSQMCHNPTFVVSIEHLVSAQHQRQRHIDIKCLCGCEIDHQLELSRQGDRQVGRIGALEDAVGICNTLGRSTPYEIRPPSAAAARNAWITGSRWRAANSLISFRWALVAGSGTTINPKFRSRPHWIIAASISLESRSGAPTTSTASLGAAATADANQLAGLAPGLYKMATRPTCGAIS